MFAATPFEGHQLAEGPVTDYGLTEIREAGRLGKTLDSIRACGGLLEGARQATLGRTKNQ